MIEATVLSVSHHEDMLQILGTLRPRQKLDSAQESEVRSLADMAAGQTNAAIDLITADTALASSPDGTAALGFLNLALSEEGEIRILIDAATKPIAARTLSRRAAAGKGFLTGGLLALQGRLDRFTEGKRFLRETTEYCEELGSYLGIVPDYGLPMDSSAIFEPFSAGKRKTLGRQIGISPELGSRLKFTSGFLEVSGDGKEPALGAANFAFELPRDFTLLITHTLPDRISSKGRAALENWSMGVKVATDLSSAPAEFGLVEHQTTPDGWVQTFTGANTGIIDVFPHGSADLQREITSVIVKDGGMLRLGALLTDADGTRYVESEVPVLGDLPILGAFFRNGTKKTKARIDNLLIFITPHVVALEAE